MPNSGKMRSAHQEQQYPQESLKVYLLACICVGFSQYRRYFLFLESLPQGLELRQDRRQILSCYASRFSLRRHELLNSYDSETKRLHEWGREAGAASWLWHARRSDWSAHFWLKAAELKLCELALKPGIRDDHPDKTRHRVAQVLLILEMTLFLTGPDHQKIQTINQPTIKNSRDSGLTPEQPTQTHAQNHLNLMTASAALRVRMRRRLPHPKIPPQ